MSVTLQSNLSQLLRRVISLTRLSCSYEESCVRFSGEELPGRDSSM